MKFPIVIKKAIVRETDNTESQLCDSPYWLA